MTPREQGRARMLAGAPVEVLDIDQVLATCGLEAAELVHGPRSVDARLTRAFDEALKLARRDAEIANNLADVAPRRAFARTPDSQSETASSARCAGVRLHVRDNATGIDSVIWQPCDRKRCANCGPRILGEHLAPAVQALDGGRPLYAGYVTASEWRTVKQRLQRAGAQAKRLPIDDDTAVVVASEPFEGAMSVASPEQLERAGEHHLAYVRKGGRARVSGIGEWKREAVTTKGISGKALIGVVTAPTTRIASILRDHTGAATFITTPDREWIGYQGGRALDDVGRQRLERALGTLSWNDSAVSTTPWAARDRLLDHRRRAA